MGFLSTLSFFVVMLVLAAMPSASVALVVTRSATRGVPNGVAVAAGIVVGDLVFVSLALIGMSALAETLGALFSVVKYAGGAYLIWLGLSLMRSTQSAENREFYSSGSTLLASALSGFVLTLGDIKAILFYASLLPTIVDVSAIEVTDVVLIVGTTILTVGGVKIVYALSARHLVKRLRGTVADRHTRTVAGGVLMGTGAYFVSKG